MPRFISLRKVAHSAALMVVPVIAIVPTVIVAQSPRAATRGEFAEVASKRTAVPVGREQTADQQVMQVLNRLAFGPRPGDVARVRATGVDAWIDRQLHPERIDDTAMNELLARYPLMQQDQTALAAQFAQLQRQSRAVKRDTARQKGAEGAGMDGLDGLDGLKQARRARAQLLGEIESARVARAVASDRQLLEVMTDFWENHFNVFAGKNPVEPYYLADYDRVVREHALGKFRDLLGAVAHSPAMLVYLDNARSRANPRQSTRGAKQDGLNENYGRELMELHTFGVDGGYTQQDVIEAARALTGWTVRPPAQGGGFIFRPQWHDTGEKVFLGHRLAAGRGEQDGEEVLDILARSPATAHFIAHKLAQRLVSDSPSTALVDAAARTYARTDGDIREVVRSIVMSPEFFSSRAYHAKVKSPFEVVVSAARALGAAPDTTVRTARAVAQLGQPVFGHRDPNGWPESGESWMNTGAILSRINFGLAVAANRLPGATLHNWPGADALSAAPRSAQVDAVVSGILGGAASPDTRKILMSGEHPLAVNAAQQGGAPPQLTGLAQVVGLALGSPEFQRR